MWAVAADIIFKHLFGRGWPDPTYLYDHLYGFHLLRGATHWDSFPSGRAAISVCDRVRTLDRKAGLARS